MTTETKPWWVAATCASCGQSGVDPFDHHHEATPDDVPLFPETDDPDGQFALFSLELFSTPAAS